MFLHLSLYFIDAKRSYGHTAAAVLRKGCTHSREWPSVSGRGWTIARRKKTFDERGRKLAGEEERSAGLRDQSRTLLDTWELWPMPSLQADMGYEL